MGLSHSPKIVTDGLVLCLDAGNANKSARGFKNLLNLSTWTVSTGSVTGFSAIGTAGQNEDRRILDTGPFGVSALVWDTPSNDATSDADGGWNTSNINIDNTKMYRFSVWLRRKTIGNGAYYLGCAGGVLNRSDGVLNNNPYFSATNWPVSIVANEWMLVVGHIWPVNSGTGTNHVDSGLWNTSGTKFSGPTSSGDFVWQTTSTTTYHRSYLYYSTDITTNQQWYQPRVDLCDGTEPTIAELIAGVGSKWYDLASTNHANIFNSAALYNNAGYMTFDGVDDFALLGSNSTYGNDTTWEAWVYCAGNVSTYNMFMGRYLPYFSFYGGNRLYFSNVIGVTQQTIQTAANLSLNTWYHATFTTSYDGTNTTMKIYTNGVETATGTFAGTQYNYANPFMIGDGNNASNTTWYPFSGRVSNVKVYNRTLSTLEILKNFNALRGRFGV
jgi:hypothetical protein